MHDIFELRIPVASKGKKQPDIIKPMLWGTYAMKLFCDKRSMSLPDLFTFLGKGNFSLTDIIDMLWCAAQYGCRKKGIPGDFDDMDVSEWIDACGGIAAGEDSQIGKFVTHIIQSTVVNTSDKKEVSSKKK